MDQSRPSVSVCWDKTATPLFWLAAHHTLTRGGWTIFVRPILLIYKHGGFSLGSTLAQHLLSLTLLHLLCGAQTWLWHCPVWNYSYPRSAKPWHHGSCADCVLNGGLGPLTMSRCQLLFCSLWKLVVQLIEPSSRVWSRRAKATQRVPSPSSVTGIKHRNGELQFWVPGPSVHSTDLSPPWRQEFFLSSIKAQEFPPVHLLTLFSYPCCVASSDLWSWFSLCPVEFEAAPLGVLSYGRVSFIYVMSLLSSCSSLIAIFFWETYCPYCPLGLLQ